MADTARMRATNLREPIYGRGRTAAWIAREVGISTTTLCRVISGERTVAEPTAQRISDLLGEPLFLLFEFTGKSKPITERSDRA